MAWYRAGGGGIPSSLKTGMDSVLNKKFGTSTTYPAEGWPDTVNLMGPLPEKTVSGAIATFADGADAVPLKKCEITLPASLDGYSEVDVVSAGKNLFDDKHLNAGLPATTIGSSIDTINTSTTRYTYQGFISPRSNVAIRGDRNDTDKVAACLVFGYKDGLLTYYRNVNPFGATVILDCTNFDFVRISIGAISNQYEAPTDMTDYGFVSVEVGTVFTSYEPYSPINTHTASLGRTIYGGTADVVSGQGESKCGKIVFDGSSDENWTAYAGGNGYLIAVADMERGTWYTSELAESYPLPKVPDNNSLGVRIGVNNNGVYVVQANTISGVTDLASFKAYLAENPLTVIYPLDDSETFTFDPVPIDSKLGNNTLWSEQGSDTEVTYRADINLALGGQ